MKKTSKLWVILGCGTASAAALIGAWAWGPWLVSLAALPPLCGLLWMRRRVRRKAMECTLQPHSSATNHPQSKCPRPTPVTPVQYDLDDPAYLAQRMLEQGRYALLLRPQIASNLQPDQLRVAMRCLDEAMGIVPEGDVLLQAARAGGDGDDQHNQRDRLVHVEAIYLDRYPVTNEQYQQFVQDGGYENMALWDNSIWPAVLDFVDRTGHPGPRRWEHGCFPAGLEDHPVVGVSWYEANAYARWVGKRLPSDPEWVKAGCWPVLTQGTRPMQRRFPWGDTMDRELAQLLGGFRKGTRSVYELPGGVSVGGIYHLIGNVWEWTTSNFGVWDSSARKLETAIPMKSIRGGAFDTYFDNQATCQFQSGDSPISRKHNIGFRCALSLRDVVEAEFDEPAAEQDTVACGKQAVEEVQ